MASGKRVAGAAGKTGGRVGAALGVGRLSPLGVGGQTLTSPLAIALCLGVGNVYRGLAGAASCAKRRAPMPAFALLPAVFVGATATGTLGAGHGLGSRNKARKFTNADLMAVNGKTLGRRRNDLHAR